MHMLFHGTPEDGTCGQRLALQGFRIIHEEFNSDGREPGGGRPSCAELGCFGCEKESGAVNRKTGDNMVTAS
jgi:hypothetical protein